MIFNLAVEQATSITPSAWRIDPFKRHATLIQEVNSAGTLPLLSLASSGVISPRTEDGGLGRQAPSPETIRRYWRVSPGDLVVNPMWLTGGGIGVASLHGAVSPDYRVYRLQDDFHPRYVHHLLRSQPYMAQYRLYTRAETTFDRRVSKENFHSMPIILPPLEEQRRIADFLDTETAHIDRMAAIRTRQVGLVDEREHTLVEELIHNGEPQTVRVKHLVSKLTSGPRGWSEYLGDDGTPFIRITNIPDRGINLDCSDLAYVRAPFTAESERSRTQEGDVLVSITADIGSVAYVDNRGVGGNVSQHLALLRPRHEVCDARWLAYAIKSPSSRQQLKMNSYGGTKVGLSLADVGELPVPAVDVGKQVTSAAALDGALDCSDRLRSSLNRQLSLMRERRAALITTAVTGQIDVSVARHIGREVG